ncbi:hypothetical protein [Gemmatimonas sp.]|uniref:hypothetical protein n=1 Tax=Gemmatimonas sp. TaxID=1962908 RepID=UPI0035676D0A
MTSTGRRGYVGVDRRWLNNPDLSDSALRLMLWLDSHSDEYLQALNILRTSEEIGWSRNRVKRTMEELEGLGLISTEQLSRQYGGTVTRITLHLDPWSDGPSRTSAMVHGEARAVVHGEARTTSNPNTEESNLETPQPPKGDEVEIVDERRAAFDSFWRVYPRKAGKPVALRSFIKAMKEDSPIAIGNGTIAWVTHWVDSDTEQQFIPHPSTFLNQKRYNDDPPAPARKKQSSIMDSISKIREQDSQ